MISIFQKQYLRKIPKSQLKREREIIINEWMIIQNHFIQTLFDYDWGSDELKSVPIFQQYNLIWIQFCEHWNNQKKHATKVDSYAFYNAFIKH